MRSYLDRVRAFSRDPHHRGLLTLVLGAYLVVVLGVMLWRGVSVTPDRTLLLIFLVALLLGRGRAFLRDWVPFLVVFLAWEVMRGFADKAGASVHYGDIIGVERFLFAGNVPTIWLQQHLYRPDTVGVIDLGAMSLYFLHFPLPLGVGFLLWLKDRRLYLRYVTAFMLMALTAFACFLVLPVSPPWLSSQLGYLPHVYKIADATVSKLHQNIDLGPIYNAMYGLNPNRVAAFPSMHAAFPFLALLYAWRTFGPRAWPLIPYTLAAWFAIVYLGEHFVVDIVGGVAFALGAYFLVEHLLRDRTPLTRGVD